jgi:hypothetical protein
VEGGYDGLRQRLILFRRSIEFERHALFTIRPMMAALTGEARSTNVSPIATR